MRASLALLVVLAGCPSAVLVPSPSLPVTRTPPQDPAKPAGPTREEVAAERLAAVAPLRKLAQDVVKDQAGQIWKAVTERVKFDAGAAWKGREELLQPEAIARIRVAKEIAPEPDRRALELLETYLAGELAARALIPATNARAAITGSATVKLGDDEAAWGEVGRALAGQADAGARARIYADQLPVYEKLAPAVLVELQAADEAVKAIGYESRAKYVEALREADVASLEALAEAVLAATDVAYRKAADKLAQQRLAVPLAKVRAADVPRLFAPSPTDAAFPLAKLVPNAKAVALGLGLHLGTQPGLTFDATDSATKIARPICLAVDPPKDVRVSVRPLAGADTNRLLLRAIGEAAAALYVRQEAWETRALGRGTSAAALAFVVEDVALTRAFLETSTAMRSVEVSAYLREASTRRLFEVRRLAARTLFTTRQIQGRLGADPAEAWRVIFGRAWGFELTVEDSKRWPDDLETWAESAEPLRARVLAAQLQRALAKRFGDAWWTDANAGEALEPLWARGGAIRITDVLALAQAGAINPGPLAEMLATGAEVSSF